MSRFGGIEAFIAGLLTPLVAAGTLGEALVVAAKGLLTEPSSYPSVFVCSDPPILTSEDSGGSATTQVYSQATLVIIRLKSDGITLGEAKQTAWTLYDIVADTIRNEHPIGAPVGTTFDVLLPGTPYEIENVNVGEFGIAIPINTNIYWNK